MAPIRATAGRLRTFPSGKTVREAYTVLVRMRARKTKKILFLAAIATDQEKTLKSEESEESEERSSDSEPVSDDQYAASTDVGSVTKSDFAWTVGPGSLNGHQLTTPTYLRVLFVSRTPFSAIRIIWAVRGTGATPGD